MSPAEGWWDGAFNPTIISSATSTGGITWGNTFTYPTSEWEERNTMSTIVTTLDQLSRLKAGDQIVIRQDGTTTSTTWVATGEGRFRRGDVILPTQSFNGAITAGNVFLPGTHYLGQIMKDGTFFYKIIGREPDGWVVAKCDSRGAARSLERSSGDPIGLTEDQAMAGNDILEPAFDTIFKLWQGEVAMARLAAILDSGEAPADVEYAVSVEIRGEVEVQPSEAQARRLVGDNKMAVLSVGGAKVAYSKTVLVTKSSRWGCACDQVGTEDLEAETTMKSWSVVSCAPVEKGVASQVHTAA